MKLKATSLIAGIAIAASTFAANADTYDFAYAESIAQQAPAVEACIADILENLTPHYVRMIDSEYGSETVGEIIAAAWIDATDRGADKELLEAAVETGIYRDVLAGDITAAAATQANADIIACVTY